MPMIGLFPLRTFRYRLNNPFPAARWFHASSLLLIKAHKLPPRPKVNEDEIEEVFIKGGGNGGQKINKTNSKVQLKHIPTGIVVSSQATRSREQNRKHARLQLAMKLQEMADPENSRAAIIRKMKVQKKKNRAKRSKKKYKMLEEQKEQKESEENGSEEAEQKEESVVIKIE